MDPVTVGVGFDLVAFTRELVDIDSTTGRETGVGRVLSARLRALGFHVVEQPVSAVPGGAGLPPSHNDRFNLIATLDAPRVVLTTHYDCVPPFFPSRVEGGLLYGRGSCDAKGILAAQIAAVERLRAEGERRVGLLFVVGEERGSDGAAAANRAPIGSAYVIDGEPTDNTLARFTRGVWRVRLRARGRAAHSSLAHLGESAIEKLLDALVALRAIALPSHPAHGTTFYTVGLIEGGVAPNVVPADAQAEILFRSIGPSAAIRLAIAPALEKVELEEILEVPPVTLETVDGFATEAFPFTTDIPLLAAWGRPLLYGPGSVLVAHADHEHVRIDALHRAVDDYVRLAKALLERA